MQKDDFQFFRLLDILKISISIIILYSILPLALAEDYRSYIKKGDQYYERFDNLNALKEYEKAYQVASDNFEVLMKLTRAYIDVGEDLKGIKFKSEEPNSNEAREYFKKAAYYAELLQKVSPNRPEPYFYLAAAYGHLALFEGGREKVRLARNVEENCKKAIELDPKFVPAYIVLGIYYREVANLNWIEKTFARALFGGLPNGTDKESERTLLKAIQLNPQIIHTHFELAKTYYVMKEEDKVIQHLKEILELPILDHQDEVIKAEAEKELRRLTKR